MQQRLNQVVIRPVDDGDINGGAPQGLRRSQSSESTADDHDMIPAALHRCAHHTTCSAPWRWSLSMGLVLAIDGRQRISRRGRHMRGQS
jgi:hypothetical protein